MCLIQDNTLQCSTFLYKMCIGAIAPNLSNIAVFFLLSSLSHSRKMIGRRTGCHFTPSRGCSISSTWWRTLMETGRPESYGPSYRFSIRDYTHTVWLYKWPGSESLCILSVIYSWRFLSFSKTWKLSLLSSMETYGEAMWQNVQKAQSSLIQLLSMAIQSLSLVLQGCLVASTALFTLPTMKRFLKHQALQRETSFTNSTIIWITGTTLAVATGALQ